MRRLYEKNPLVFALIWIGVYVVGFSLADGLSQSLVVEKVITAPLCVLMTTFLLLWLNNYNSKIKFMVMCCMCSLVWCITE